MKVKTEYTKAQIDEISHKFLERFDSDSRSFNVKLKSIGMPKGTYSRLINNGGISKRTLERMKAFLDKRPVKFVGLKEGHSYCGMCENVYDSNFMRDQWTCKSCDRAIDLKYVMKNRLMVNNRKALWRLKKKYGKFHQCVRSILELSKQVRTEYGNEEN